MAIVVVVALGLAGVLYVSPLGPGWWGEDWRENAASRVPYRVNNPRTDTRPSGQVTNAMFGESWPFTVDSGTLACDRGATTFTDPRGRVWALNGVAISRGIRELDDTIWLDSKTTGAKVSVAEMIDRALDLCDWL